MFWRNGKLRFRAKSHSSLFLFSWKLDAAVHWVVLLRCSISAAQPMHRRCEDNFSHKHTLEVIVSSDCCMVSLFMRCAAIENKCMIRLGWRVESARALSTFQSFMCIFQTYMYNIIQSKLALLPFSKREKEMFWLQDSFAKWHWLFVSFPSQFCLNLPHHFLWKLCIWSRLRASGSLLLEVRWGLTLLVSHTFYRYIILS